MPFGSGSAGLQSPLVFGRVGGELWVSDGTREGTDLIRVLPGGVAREGFVSLGGGLALFRSSEGLWATDGTVTGTRSLGVAWNERDGFSNYAFLADGRLLFKGYDHLGGNELWVTDGTRNGTQRVADIVPGVGSSGPNHITDIGDGRAVFVALDGTHGAELWISDGTGSGTNLVKDITPEWTFSGPSGVSSLGSGTVIFTADDQVHGRELWISDGTKAGTRMVADIAPGPDSSNIVVLGALADERALLTVPSDEGGFYNRDLWVTDGTALGTRPIFTGFEGQNSYSLSALSDFVALKDGRGLFVANDGTHGEELWVSDGTSAGTRLVTDIAPGSDSAYINHITPFGEGKALFSAKGFGVPNLWVTDGTAEGTHFIGQINSNGYQSIIFNIDPIESDLAILSGYIEEDSYTRPWITDGTSSGTTPLENKIAEFPSGVTTIGVLDRSLDVRGELSDAAEIFDENGKLPFLAALAQAAYRLADDEPQQVSSKSPSARNNPEPNSAEPAYKDVADALQLIGRDILPGLVAPFRDKGWMDGLRSEPNERGIYTNDNAAALISRSADAVFIGFRGTNDKVDTLYDHAHWINLSGHFKLVRPMLKQVASYIVERSSLGDSIEQVYLSGHSMGGAMVQAAYGWFSKNYPHIKVEGVTFASPGYGMDPFDLKDNTDPPITNFWNSTDLINLPAGAQTILGDQFTFNNALSEAIAFAKAWSLDDFAPTHNMDLYQAIIDFLYTEGEKHGFALDLDNLTRLVEPTNFFETQGLDRIATRIKWSEEEGFSVGKGNNFVMAGAWEMLSTAVTSASTNKAVKGAANNIQKGVKAAELTFDLLDLMAEPAVKNGGINLHALEDLASWETILDLWNVASNFDKRLKAADIALKSGFEYFAEDLVVGGDGRDQLWGLGGRDTLLGGDGRDALKGGPGDDSLFGGDGNDVLEGGPRHDRLAGGHDRDFLYGGGGRDVLIGGRGDDVLDGGADQDILKGGPGDDFYILGSDSDAVEEKEGNGIDTVLVTSSFQLPANFENLQIADSSVLGNPLSKIEAVGNGASNRIVGNDDGNILSGRGAADLLVGNGGRDTISGGQGRDTILGGTGLDDLDGGPGADVFLFTQKRDAKRIAVGSAAEDIFNFVSGEDTIDFRFFNGKFVWRGTAPFTGDGGEIRYVEKGRGDDTRLVVHVDLDGKGLLPDMRLNIYGASGLTSDDFVL